MSNLVVINYPRALSLSLSANWHLLVMNKKSDYSTRSLSPLVPWRTSSFFPSAERERERKRLFFLSLSFSLPRWLAHIFPLSCSNPASLLPSMEREREGEIGALSSPPFLPSFLFSISALRRRSVVRTINVFLSERESHWSENFPLAIRIPYQGYQIVY